MGHYPLFVVDVFAEEKYAGNQLAVVANAASLSTADMQRIARETNFSETTFVLSDKPRDGGFDVRIFTPANEMPFAGHPTLGTAWVIRHYLAADRPRQVALNLQLAQIPVSFRDGDDGVERAWMRTPQPSFGQRFDAKDLAPLHDLDPSDIDARFPIEEVAIGVGFTFVPVRSLAAMKRARFRLERFEQIQHLGFNPCTFLFCPETYSAENQLNARLFGAAVGIAEDPATGSANACLAAYLLRHSYIDGDHIHVRVEQGYEIGRPSLLYLHATRRGEATEIEVGGRVIPTARGELL